MEADRDRRFILSWLWENDATRLEELWHVADSVRKAHVGDAVHLRGLIEISNVCVRQCAYCGLRAGNTHMERYGMEADEIVACARRAAGLGYGTVVLQGGEDYGLSGSWVSEVLRRIKSAFPKFWLHVFSPSEIVWFAREAGVSVCECVARLKAAGADSVPGAADILVPHIRRELCGNKCTVDEWLEVMRALAQNDMSSSATMTFGIGETFAERIEHLDVVRKIQDETNVFRAFIAWPVAPENTEIEGKVERVGSPEFLKMLAISRIYLDNIKYVQSGWLTEGLRAAEIALLFGANDVGGVLMDEMVVRAAGIDNRATPENMRRVIKNAGFVARERDGLYNTVKTF